MLFIKTAIHDMILFVSIVVLPILEATLLAISTLLLARAISVRIISKMNIMESNECRATFYK